ncbi:hypothetical protein Dimus_007122 [Dionaea muscipula]
MIQMLILLLLKFAGHHDLNAHTVKLFSQMHVPPEKCFATWECALCISPNCEASILCFSKQYTDAFKSIDHWINCFSVSFIGNNQTIKTDWKQSKQNNQKSKP